MSVTFFVQDTAIELNVSNTTAEKIFTAGGIKFDRFNLVGEVTAVQLTAAANMLKSELNLFWQEPPVDAFLGFDGPRFINFGYDSDRLAGIAERLAVVAEAAGDRPILYG